MNVNCLPALVYPSDLEYWCGKGEGAAHRLYQRICNHFGVEHKLSLTIYHLRDFYKISIEDVINSIPRLKAIVSKAV